MIDHVTANVGDFEQAKRFYTQALAPLGYSVQMEFEGAAGFGNSVEAVHHGRTREPGSIDHLWIRVADVSASQRFYQTIAPHAGLRLANVFPERVHFAGASSSFGLVAGEPTEQLHMAFPADDDETVRTFHRVAIDAGYRDNGTPGERDVYHPGYYGAFILDPDGNNVEVVNHNR